MGWRWLTRMRTALWMLQWLGVLTAVATVIPQAPNVPSTVERSRAPQHLRHTGTWPLVTCEPAFNGRGDVRGLRDDGRDCREYAEPEEHPQGRAHACQPAPAHPDRLPHEPPRRPPTAGNRRSGPNLRVLNGGSRGFDGHGERVAVTRVVPDLRANPTRTHRLPFTAVRLLGQHEGSVQLVRFAPTLMGISSGKSRFEGTV